MQSPSGDSARHALFRNRNFLWLLAGASVSMLGDQLTLIALPWLVLQMTHDPWTLGLVLALAGVPRAAFMLVGGALVDRHDAKRVLMCTKHMSTVALALLAALLLTGNVSLGAVGMISFVLGLAMAFSIPAATSMLPHTVPPHLLPAANGVMLGLRQVSMFVGPLVAGGLIAWFAVMPGDAGFDPRGVGAAFALDALSFAVSAWTLSHVRMRHTGEARGSNAQPVWSSVTQGLAWCWNDRDLRTCFLYWSAIALLVTGPIQIALPVLASAQPGFGAAAFGILMGAHGAGTLLGMGYAGARPSARLRTLGATLLAVDAAIGALFAPLGYITSLWQGIALLVLIGLLGGFVQVTIFTWIQRRVPHAYLGRTMSIFMFIFIGLAPLSAVVAGWAMKVLSVGQLFAVCGLGLVLTAVLASMATRMRHIVDVQPAVEA